MEDKNNLYNGLIMWDEAYQYADRGRSSAIMQTFNNWMATTRHIVNSEHFIPTSYHTVMNDDASRNINYERVL